MSRSSEYTRLSRVPCFVPVRELKSLFPALENERIAQTDDDGACTTRAFTTDVSMQQSERNVPLEC